jgi:hypothetical protein
MKKSNRSGYRSAAAMILTASALAVAASPASAGPAFFPMPDVYRQATQGFYLVGCGGETCEGAFFAEDYFDPNGDYQGSSLTVQEFGPSGGRAAICPINRGELTVRDDAGLATLNATINVADCQYVTETCDEDGVCKPDYEGTITIAATATRPAATASSSTRSQVRAKGGYMSTYNCQEKTGQTYEHVSVAVNGHAWIASDSQGSKRDCGGVSKSE